MPIPLLFLGAAAGIFGVGKSIKAGIDQKDANDINDDAERIVKEASEKIETCRDNCGTAIEDLGLCKIHILDESIKVFVNEYDKLRDVTLSESQGLNELQKMSLDENNFSELKELQSMASSMITGAASGAMAGAITAFGAYGAVSALATASTGTAIASLTGAAATNATLAFLGGGTLAAGGLGITGGTAVLGGLVAGPALAVLGVVVGAQASANKEKAYSNLCKANEFKEEMDAAASMCMEIRKRANMCRRFLLSLNSLFEPLVWDMTKIIRDKGTDFRTYSENEKKTIAEAMSTAKAIKTIIDTPILNDEGNLAVESEKIIDRIKEKTKNNM